MIRIPIASRYLVLTLATVLAGCAALQGKRAAEDPWARYAEDRMQAGDYLEAARIFSDMASKSKSPDYYRFRGADAYLRAGNNSAAQALMTSVDRNELADDDRTDYDLLSARLNLNVGRAPQAMTLLDRVAKARRNPTQDLHYHLLRASAYNQLGQMLESARERVKLAPLLTASDAVQKNNEAIFDALNRLPDGALKGRTPAPPDPLGGWIELTEILRSASVSDLGTELGEWRSRFPDHPADGAFLDEVLRQSGKHVEIKPAPRRPAPAAPAATTAGGGPTGAPFIGVMLPLTGSYAPAGEAIRSGMLAAFYSDSATDKLPLRFADSQAGGVERVYSELASQGAALTVGPLLKEEVSRVFRIPDRTIPILALNQVSDLSDPKVVQFGLTPEQEVEQAAGAAWFDGHHQAVVLAPDSGFGQRLVSHFTRYWRSLGGKVVATKTYAPNSTDYSRPAQELAPLFRPKPVDGGSSSPEAKGAEFIFLIANAHDARLIKPQLDVNNVSAIPVFATSHVFSGRPDVQQDRDLDGIYFCDIPWLLHSYDPGPLSSTALSAEIEKTAPDFVKLIALGIDAYRLARDVPSMATIPGQSFDGATGLLSLQAGNRVQRQLECAQFQGGVPQSRGLAPILHASESARR